jgi:hypothetical protein
VKIVPATLGDLSQSIGAALVALYSTTKRSAPDAPVTVRL